MIRLFFLLTPIVLFLGCAPPATLKESITFYPALPQQPRLQYLTSINSEDDIRLPENSFMEFLIGDIQSEKQIQKPYDIGSSPGKIYVLDRNYSKLLIIDLARKTFSHIDDQGMGALAEPSGIWVSKNGTKYIADMKRKQVVVFDEANNFLRDYGTKDFFAKPVDVVADENSVFVCDMKKNQIFILDKDSGRLKKTIGNLEGERDNLNNPTHISLDRAGNLYVNDAFNYTIRKFDRDGRFMKSFGFHGDIVGAFARPKGLDIDRDGYMYVVDSAYENVQIFDSNTGRLLLFFGGSGTTPGSMYLPVAVHIDYENTEYFKNFVDENFSIKYVVYVGNMFGGNKLNVYGFGQWTGPYVSGDENETAEYKDNNRTRY